MPLPCTALSDRVFHFSGGDDIEVTGVVFAEHGEDEDILTTAEGTIVFIKGHYLACEVRYREGDEDKERDEYLDLIDRKYKEATKKWTPSQVKAERDYGDPDTSDRNDNEDGINF